MPKFFMILFFLMFTLNAQSQNFSLSFDGSDDYVSIADHNELDFIDNYTLEAWVKAESFSWLGGIISKYQTNAANGFTLRLTDVTPYDGVGFDGKYTSLSQLNLEQWYHIAAVKDGVSRKMYINGIEVQLYGSAHTIYANFNPIRIGCDYSSRYFDGNIDEVRLWNVARSETEIAGNMSTALTGQESGLVAYYNFNEGSGQILTDLTGNNHHGTINGATWSTVSPEMENVVFQPQTKEELQTAVDLWVSDETSAIATYGEINTWDVSLITDMQYMFKSATNFNEDISTWNVSSVTNMREMFDNASDFNGDLSSWDVSNVTDMQYMFKSATNFNGDISTWNVSNVTDMDWMFKSATSFNGDISSWDVSNVLNMWDLFANASSFNQDISSWDVSNTQDMGGMFNGALALSEENQCVIHTSFSSNSAWPYDWSESCMIQTNNYSLAFDGNGWVNLGNLNYISEGVAGEYTVVTNIRFNNTTGSQFIFGDEIHGNNGVMMQLQGGSLATHFNPGSYHYSNFTPSVNTDYNIVFRQNSEGMQIFIDGVLRGDFVGKTHSEVTHPTGLGVFGVGESFQRFFNGVMHDCIIYGEALGDELVTGLISEHSYPVTNNLYAYYNFSTGSGDIVFDQSGNNHDGTLSGATWQVDDPLNTLFVSIPDQNFEQKLIDLGYDDVLDGQVLMETISNIEELNISNADISDLTGLESFTLLKDLNVSNNLLSLLDVSSNVYLERLSLNHNEQITALDVTQNTNLYILQSYWTNIDNIDLTNNPLLVELNLNFNPIDQINLSNNPLLEHLSLNNHLIQSELTNIDLSNNPALRFLDLHGNPISEIDLSQQTQLRDLNLMSSDQYDNLMTEIDLSNNVELEVFRIDAHPVGTIDLTNQANLWLLMVARVGLEEIDLAQNTMLRVLDISQNQINEVDLTLNTELRELNLSNNQLSAFDFSPWANLTHLNLYNNQLTNITFGETEELQYLNLFNNSLESLEIGFSPDLRTLEVHQNNLHSLKMHHGSEEFTNFNSTSNSELKCIDVLDVAYHTERFTSDNGSIDREMFFSENCGPVVAVNPDYLSEILSSGETLTKPITIQNDGESTLNWELEIEIPNSSDRLSSNGCVEEYSDEDCGWGLAAFEDAGFTQNLRYLGVDSDIMDLENAGNVGHLLENYSGEVLIVAGDKYYKFTSETNIFENIADPFIDLYDFESNDDQLNTWVEQDGGVKFCRASEYPNIRPGDTSWGLTPNGSAQRDCGCNSGGWSGYGTFYGGFDSNCTSCGCQGGGWSGTRASGQNKGQGGYMNVDVAIYVRENSDWLSSSLESGSLFPGEQVSVDIVMDANGLTNSVYSSNIVINSNDSENPQLFIPVDLTVVDYLTWGSLPDTSIDEDSNLQFEIQINSSEYYEFSILSDTSAITAEINGDLIYLTPLQDWSGSSTIEVTLTQSEEIVTESFILTVNEINDKPIATHTLLEMDEDQSIFASLEVDDGDPYENETDQQELEFTIISNFSHGSSELDQNNGEFNYIPDENFNGSDTMVYQVMDNGTSNGVSDPQMDTASVFIFVQPVNDPPIIGDIRDITMEEDQILPIALEITDVDNDILEISASLVDEFDIDPVLLYVYSDGDSLLIDPIQDWFGNVNMIITANDGELTTEREFNLQVNSVDDDPSVVSYLDDVYLYEDFEEIWESNLNDVFVDVDGPLEFSANISSEVVSFQLENGFLTFSSLDNVHGEAEMIINASNPVRATVSDTILITIFGVNDPPLLDRIEDLYLVEDVPYELWTMEDLFLSGALSDVDNSFDELSFSLNYEPYLFYIDWSQNPVDVPVLYPNENLFGSEIVQLCVSDFDSESCRQFGVILEPVDDAPFFYSNMDEIVGKGFQFDFEISYDDIDTDYENIELSILNGPEWDYYLENNHLIGIPENLGSYPFVLQLQDAENTVVDTLNLHVENFTPVITSIVDVPEDQGGRVYVNFQKSFFDVVDAPNQFYNILRKDEVNEIDTWISVGSISSSGSELYTTEVATLTDANGQSFPESDNILAFYPFNGNSIDQSGNGYDGELFGSVSLTTDQNGNVGSAYHFDGDDESTRIVVSENIPLSNQSHTISLKIKPDEGAYFGGAHMFGHGTPNGNNGLHARFNGDENIQYAFWGNDISFDQPNPGSTDWHQLVFTFDRSSNLRKLFVDGVLIGENTTAAPYVGNGPLVIGGHVFAYGGQPWHGKIDDFVIWDVALTEPQVLEISDVESNFTIDDGMTEFKIVAHMNEGTFQSESLSGFSVDNIAPEAPAGLVAVIGDDGINLSWDESNDNDFEYFLIEKSLSDDFIDPTVHQAQENSFTDLDYEMNQTYFYRLLSVDYARNQSLYSNVVEAAVLTVKEDIIPQVFALHQNYPNPFNPTTQIRFDIANDVMVYIKIFDLMGREVKTLVNTVKSAGYYSLQWDATNTIGESVSAGMYIYTIQAGKYRATKKMVLLK